MCTESVLLAYDRFTEAEEILVERLIEAGIPIELLRDVIMAGTDLVQLIIA